MISTLFLAYMAVAWLFIYWGRKYCFRTETTIDAAYLFGLFWPVSIILGIYLMVRRHLALRKVMRR